MIYWSYRKHSTHKKGNIMKIIGLLILAVFYAVYFCKMIVQKRKGIQTDQIAKGKQKTKAFYIELVMKIATYSVVVAEVLSLFFAPPISAADARCGRCGSWLYRRYSFYCISRNNERQLAGWHSRKR